MRNNLKFLKIALPPLLVLWSAAAAQADKKDELAHSNQNDHVVPAHAQRVAPNWQVQQLMPPPDSGRNLSLTGALDSMGGSFSGVPWSDPQPRPSGDLTWPGGFSLHDGLTSGTVPTGGVTHTPEPGTSVLLGFGLGCLFWRRARR